MNKIMLFFLLVFQSFFLLYSQAQDIMVGTITIAGSESMSFTEYSDKNTHTIVIYDTISRAQKNELRDKFETIFSSEQVKISDQSGAIVISFLAGQNEYLIKSLLKDTIEGKKMLTVSVYRVSAIRMLEQMTKKPILEYAKGKKMLSEIA